MISLIIPLANNPANDGTIAGTIFHTNTEMGCGVTAEVNTETFESTDQVVCLS
jgi:hypothetical protein